MDFLNASCRTYAVPSGLPQYQTLGCGVRASVGVDGLVCTSRGGVVVVRTKVDEQQLVSGSIGADEPRVVLWASDCRAAPLDCVATPHEGAESIGRCLPGHGELHNG